MSSNDYGNNSSRMDGRAEDEEESDDSDTRTTSTNDTHTTTQVERQCIFATYPCPILPPTHTHPSSSSSSSSSSLNSLLQASADEGPW